MRPNKIEDVWKRVAVKSTYDCWLWTGGTFNNGYGRYAIDQKSRTAHKLVYELVNGNVVPGLVVMHKCNNKLCCNPEHLVAGTVGDNAKHASTSGAFKAGKTGIIGVGFSKKRGYWTAQGWKKGRRVNLYTGPNFEKAVSARKNWESKNAVTFEGINK